MRDSTLLSRVLLDTLSVVTERLRPTTSPFIVFSGDVNISELLLGSDGLPLPWVLAAKGPGYSGDVLTENQRSQCFNDRYAYAVSLSFAKSTRAEGELRRSDRVDDEVRAYLVEQVIQDAGEVVLPEGLLDSSDMQIGQQLVIISCFERVRSPFSSRFWSFACEQFSGFSLQSAGKEDRRISGASGWQVTTKWGCLKI